MKSKTSVFVSQKHRVSHFVKNGTKIIAESFQIRLQIICWISKNSLVKDKHNKKWEKTPNQQIIYIIEINVKIPKISKYFHLVTNSYNTIFFIILSYLHRCKVALVALQKYVIPYNVWLYLMTRILFYNIFS